MKTCSRCKMEKEDSRFCKKTCKKDGLNNECRECAANRYDPSKFDYTSKVCKGCGEEKDLTAFHEDMSRVDGRSTRCVPCRIKYFRAHDAIRRADVNYTRPKRNKYKKNRKQRDMGYRVYCNLNRRLHKVLMGNPKHTTTMNLVGCGYGEIKAHIEGQFTKGMSWENYGDWHIDHIVPCASFDLTQPDHQEKCFHYTNLQPLWAKDNLAKSDKIITA